MNVYPPFRRGFDVGPVYLHGQQGPTALQWATFALVVLLVLMLGAMIVARAASGGRRMGPHRGFAFAGPPGPPPGPPQQPRELLALRYARGEISRDDFLRATDDVSAEAPTVEQPPG